MRYVTAEEMRSLDKAAIEAGTPALDLMEAAGKRIAEEAMRLTKKGGRVVIFAGYGNNGGDGLVAARHLAGNGYKVKVYFVGRPKSLSPETNSNLEALFSSNITPKTIPSKEDVAKMFAAMKPPDVAIDAIFGIGIHGSLDDLSIALIDKINSLKSPIVAADIPSGLDADTGEPLPKAIKATVTVTMGFPKAGFRNAAAKEYIGRMVVADIGLGPAAEKRTGPYKEVILRQGRRGRTLPHHPWIYKSQILKAAPAVKPGETISVIDSTGKMIGRGYYNPLSDIAVRLLTFRDEKIDGEFLTRRIKAAAEKRRDLTAVSDAWRAVYSEADGLPGLIVDIYAGTAVFQVLTLGMERMKGALIEAIRSAISPKYIYEKSDSPFRKMEGLPPAKGWHGEIGHPLIEIREGAARFIVDIVNGHKTGFYLDQRRSRMALAAFVKGKTVLDLFCYTGGFAVTAAASGASRVRGVDIKEEWLSLGRRNAELNGVSGKTALTAGDAFNVLREIYAAGERFDIIIVDPPSFARSKGSLKGAEKGYKDINLMAIKTLAEGGILATFSCSHNMPNELFADTLKRAARDARKKLAILRRCHQAEDHPIVRTVPETEYLKGYFFKVTSA